MDYNKEYEYYYDKWYSKFENDVKLKLIESKNKNVKFGIISKELTEYFSEIFPSKPKTSKNKNLYVLFELFQSKKTEYEDDKINLTITNIIEPEFKKISPKDLPVNYSLKKFVADIAKYDVSKEICRLMTLNSIILEKFYKINDFSEFELREHRGLSVENYPIFVKLNKILNPEYYTNTTENDSIVLSINDPKLPLAITLLNEIGFFNLEKIKGFSAHQLAKLISLIQMKNPRDKNTIRSISGNIRVVTGGSDDATKYTAGSYKNTNLANKLFKEIKEGE